MLEIIQPGQTFAEALLFSQARCYPVSATALKDSVLVSIEGQHYRNALEDAPKVCLAILASMSIHLHQRLKDIDTLTLANASRRVINFLFQERDALSGEVVLQVPKRLVVLGGGPIGSELTQSFARFGAQVTQVEMAPRIMIREDEEVSALAQASLEADGVAVLTGHKALRCEVVNGEKTLVVEHGGAEQRIAFDQLICAVGRVARLTGYGLEDLGIPTNRTVETNEYLQTLYPNIYAAGDVAGPYQFTHVAAHQAWYAAVNALFGDFKKFKADYRVIPWATFIDPEVARVGLNEQEAKAQGVAYEVTKYGIDDLDRAIADSEARGWVKVLTVPGKDRILGVTIVGTHAADLLAEYVLAMKHGLGLNKILGTIHTYPTLAEANKYAAGEWKRAHAPARLLIWVKRFHDWRRG